MRDIGFALWVACGILTVCFIYAMLDYMLTIIQH